MLLIASGTAHADPPRVPIGIIGTVGFGVNSPGNDLNTSSPDQAFSVKLDVGYRFHERLMIGFHGAFSSAVTEHEYSTDSMFDTDYQYAVLPLQLGITGLYAVDDHTYVWGGRASSAGGGGSSARRTCTTACPVVPMTRRARIGPGDPLMEPRRRSVSRSGSIPGWAAITGSPSEPLLPTHSRATTTDSRTRLSRSMSATASGRTNPKNQLG